MTVPSPTGAYLPLGPVPGRRQASSAAVSEGAAQRKEAHWIGYPQSDARRPVSVGRESASAQLSPASRAQRSEESTAWPAPCSPQLLPTSLCVQPASDGENEEAASAETPTA